MFDLATINTMNNDAARVDRALYNNALLHQQQARAQVHELRTAIQDAIDQMVDPDMALTILYTVLESTKPKPSPKREGCGCE